MERQLLGALNVRCSATALELRLRDLLVGSDAKVELEVPFETLGFPAIGKLSRRAVITLGASHLRSDGATLVPIHWKDSNSQNFPEFKGFVEIVPMAKDESQLAIIGQYHPPFGPIGAAFDAAIGKRIAEVSVELLLERLRSALEKE